MTTTLLLLVGTAILQGTAAVVALRLIRLTSSRPIWLALAVGFGLMAGTTIFRVVTGSAASQPDLFMALSPLVLSALCLGGMIWLTPLFLTVQHEKNARQQQHGFVEKTHELTCTHDMEGRLLSVAPAIAELYGSPPEDFIGENVRDFLAPSVRVYFDEYLAHIQQEKTASGLMRVLTKQDEERILLYDSVYVDEAGTEPYVLAHAQDLTARLETENALRESEARYRALVEQSLAGIYIIQDGYYRYVNPKFAEIFGYTPEEITTTLRHGQELIAEADRPTVQANVQRRLGGATESLHYTFGGKRKDGTLIDVEVHGTAMDYNGRPAVIGILLDVTERARAERERRGLENQLQQAQKMEALGTLAGGIAHDFNNILAAIIGYTELALIDLPPASLLRHNLQEVHTAGQRAKELVQQILTFSRRREPERRPLALAPLVQEALSLLRASLPSTIEIRQHIVDDAGTILGDATQIHQVLMNLCTNAEHAMRETDGTLEVRVEPRDIDAASASHDPAVREGSYVCLTVHDTGHGITPDIMERIFDPFFTTKGTREGTGMGLAMVHGVMASHQGAITVQSPPGKGTTFALYFPRLTTPTDPDTPSEALPTHGSGHILFVDDEESLVRVSEAILTRAGYRVTACTNSLEALKRFEVAPASFDLVITDQTMPHMTGADLMRALRRLRPDIPVILCTGFSHVIDAEKAQELGANIFMMKPLDFNELVHNAHQLTESQPQAHTPLSP